MRAFTIGNAIDRGFRVWARNLVPFTLLTVVVYAPLIVGAYLLTHRDVERSTLRLYGPVSALVVSVLNILLSAVLTYGVVMELRGARASLVACIAVGLRRFIPALGVALLTMLAVAGGTLLLIVPGVIVGCMLYVAVPASIVEKPGVLGALRRSRELTDGRKVDIFALTLLVGLLPGLLATVARFWLLGLDDSRASASAWIDYIHVQTGLTVAVGAFGAVFPAVSYFLLRQDREGASLDELVRVFD
jgi:hypothetical protein